MRKQTGYGSFAHPRNKTAQQLPIVVRAVRKKGELWTAECYFLGIVPIDAEPRDREESTYLVNPACRDMPPQTMKPRNTMPKHKLAYGETNVVMVTVNSGRRPLSSGNTRTRPAAQWAAISSGSASVSVLSEPRSDTRRAPA